MVYRSSALYTYLPGQFNGVVPDKTPYYSKARVRADSTMPCVV